MYIMKRTDIVFVSEGEMVRGILDGIKLNKVLELEGEKIKKYRVMKGKDYYNVDKEEWEKIKMLYSEVLDKEIYITTSYEIPTKNSNTYCYVDEEDYCSIVRKINLEEYDMKDIKYKYFVETKSVVSKTDMEFEIDESTYEMIKNMNN